MKVQRNVLRFIMLMMFILIGVIILPPKLVFAAADAVKVMSVDYYEEQVIIQNNGNSKICFATEVDAGKGNWEVINADSGEFTTIDMSWLSTTVESIVVFKGAEDPKGIQSRITFNEKPTKLEIAINYANMDTMSSSASIASLVNIMTSVGTGEKPITFADLEWRKGSSGQWTKTEELTVGLLEKYLVKGTYLYFRIRAVDDVVTVKSATGGTVINFNQRRKDNLGGFLAYYKTNVNMDIDTDYPDGLEGRRFSNEVKIKIAKKSTAMVYGIDGEDFTAEIKYGKQYRVTIGSSTTPSAWFSITDRSIKLLPLSTIINNPAIDGTTKDKAFPSMKIEIRNYATSKSASSKITEINLNAQRTIDDTAIKEVKAPVDAIEKKDSNIYITYNGNKNILLQIPTASAGLPYEYCVVKPGENFQLTKAVWASVTKGTEIKILATKAVDGGKLIIRKKEIKSKAATANSNAVEYALASTYVSFSINYPSVPEIVDTVYTFTKTYSSDISFIVTLNAEGKKPFEYTIKSIKLGTREIEYTSTKDTNATGVQTLTVTLKKEALATFANCFSKAITISYKNGTVDKTSIKLTIQSPVSAGALTFTRAKGTAAGMTSFTMVSSKLVENSWVYVVTDSAITSVNTVDTVAIKTSNATQTKFTTTTVDNIAISDKQYLTVFEVNAAGSIVKYGSLQITSEYIGVTTAP